MTKHRIASQLLLLSGTSVLGIGCDLDDFSEEEADAGLELVRDSGRSPRLDGRANRGGMGGAGSEDPPEEDTKMRGGAGTAAQATDGGTDAGRGDATDDAPLDGGTADKPGAAGAAPEAGAAPDDGGLNAAPPASEADGQAPAETDASPEAGPEPQLCVPQDCPAESPACLAGVCVACIPGTKRCGALGVELCTEFGEWQAGEPCIGGTCIDGKCAAPSCDGLAETCGQASDGDCCASPFVQGGEYLRNGELTRPVAISDYHLDEYEVTVGRFRKFLDARATWSPSPGDGSYPRVTGSGWGASWPLATTEEIAAEVRCDPDAALWTDEAGGNENRPMNCVNWYEAFAFCAWDGGHLATDSQWEYAAAGGDEERFYPWSSPPTSSAIDLSYTSYFCPAEPQDTTCFNRVGAKPLGDGKYGHADLGGNVAEWLMDRNSADLLACEGGVNCLHLGTDGGRLLRGGSATSWNAGWAEVYAGAYSRPAIDRSAYVGFRCARPTPEDFLQNPEEAPGEHTECIQGQLSCDMDTPTACDLSGKWTRLDGCEFACVNGACTECSGDTRGCKDNVPQACGTDGFWRAEAACSGETPVCTEGNCVPVCLTQNNCGPAGNENCCQSLLVPGGTFNRRNDETLPASVSPFELEKYEATVGRFREFVQAYPGSVPAAGAGAHPLIAGTGWNDTWNAELPGTREELIEAVLSTNSSDCDNPLVLTYTREPGVNESRPMNCVSWYEAFAFCAWSGGRLPTLAELSFAGSGGEEQRPYPWSSPANSTAITNAHATYDGNECPEDSTDRSTCTTPVGSKPLGNGRWGHSDLAGNVAEHVLDFSTEAPTPCADCAKIDTGTNHLVFGGGFDYNDANALVNGARPQFSAGRDRVTGIRCVR